MGVQLLPATYLHRRYLQTGDALSLKSHGNALSITHISTGILNKLCSHLTCITIPCNVVFSSCSTWNACWAYQAIRVAGQRC